jgi:hypothetical protein
MGRKTKFVFLLLVYLSGFATAIYLFAPEPELHADSSGKDYIGTKLSKVEFDSNEFVQTANAGMHKCLDFGKEASCHIYKFIKQWIAEREKS